MKLYLSSYKLGNNVSALVGLFRENKKVAYISNALDFSRDFARRESSELEQIEALKQLGFVPEPLDLREYFGKPEELRAKLGSFGGVWVNGGNTFVLRLAYLQSGFDEIIKAYTQDHEKKGFVYAGFSAAGCVLQQSLKGIEFIDDPSETRIAYGLDAMWEGVGLIGFKFVPHFESEHDESEDTNKEVEFYKQNGLTYRTVRDGEALLILDGKVELIS